VPLQPDTAVPIAAQIEQVRKEIADKPDLATTYDELVRELPLDRLAALIRTHGSHVGFTTPLKYLDCPFWIYHKLLLAQRLGLDKSTGRNVLDIGMGGGHFSYVLEHLGHATVGIDIANPIYEDICAALGVKRITQAVMLGTPIDLGIRFDVVTAFAAQFFKLPDGSVWRTQDWKDFLHDLITRSMRSPGRIYFTLNSMSPEAAASVDLQAVAAAFSGTFSAKGSRLDIPV